MADIPESKKIRWFTPKGNGNTQGNATEGVDLEGRSDLSDQSIKKLGQYLSSTTKKNYYAISVTKINGIPMNILIERKFVEIARKFVGICHTCRRAGPAGGRPHGCGTCRTTGVAIAAGALMVGVESRRMAADAGAYLYTLTPFPALIDAI